MSLVDWNETNIERLRAGLAAGESYAQIAKHIRNCTRNGAIGKAKRMGFEQPGSATTLRQTWPRSPAIRPQARAFGETRVPPAKPVLKLAGNTQVFEASVAQPPRGVAGARAWAPLPGVAPVPFMERRGLQCRWPVSVEPGEHHCCGARMIDERYCATHAERSRSKDTRQSTAKELARSLRRYVA
jgi:hypothetical protein